MGLIEVQSLRARRQVITAISKLLELRWATWNESFTGEYKITLCDLSESFFYPLSTMKLTRYRSCGYGFLWFLYWFGTLWWFGRFREMSGQRRL